MKMSKITRTDVLRLEQYFRSYLPFFAVTMQLQEEEKRSEVDAIEPGEAAQAEAWLDMMYEESGLTPMRANRAASIIQVSKNQVTEAILYCILHVKLLYIISCQIYAEEK